MHDQAQHHLVQSLSYRYAYFSAVIFLFFLFSIFGNYEHGSVDVAPIVHLPSRSTFAIGICATDRDPHGNMELENRRRVQGEVFREGERERENETTVILSFLTLLDRLAASL